MEVDSLSLCREQVSVSDVKLVTSSFSYCSATLLSKNYITVQHASFFLSLSLLIGETMYQSIITGKYIFLSVTVFPIPHYNYVCNTVCHKKFTMIHSSAYRLGYREAIISITLGYHKANITASSFSVRELLELQANIKLFFTLSFHF